ncbi:MAG: hypothetical protein IT462_11785 [Planctomycetes bacterium]|nr:hypothetical protein [Planctomycetota bacterium]
MPESTSKPVAADAALPKRVRTLTLLAGLTLAMLLLLGATGLASVTLMYVTSPLHGGQYNRYEQLPDLEDTVVKTVISLRPLIKTVHMYGPYVTVLLSGFAAIQCISVSRLLAKSEDSKQRSRGRLVAMLGSTGGFLLALAVLAQAAAGTFAAWGMRSLDDSFLRSGSAPAIAALQPDAQLDETRTEAFVGFHIRELNYPVGICALMLLAAMSMARTAAQASGPPAKPSEQNKV